jgi:hypothetical protein
VESTISPIVNGCSRSGRSWQTSRRTWRRKGEEATSQALGRVFNLSLWSDEFEWAPPMQVIYTTLRDITVEDMDWYLEDCLQLKKEFPEEIVGMDFVFL